ncbi:MAG: formate dehydrogenase accessory sulfurtransferase FdhD [Verrucomicrobiota bacterium]
MSTERSSESISEPVAISSLRKCRVIVKRDDDPRYELDRIIAEEPLNILLKSLDSAHCQPWTMSMWTPGNGREFVLGLLFTEGLISQPSDVLSIDFVTPNEAEVTLVELPALEQNRNDHRRSSACGVCGKESFDALDLFGLKPVEAGNRFPDLDLNSLGSMLNNSESLFAQTGGSHATALISPYGECLTVMEDIGRHNAVDKVIGHGLANDISFDHCAILLSSRIGYEIVHKAARAQVPMILAMGAASSLAVEIAERLNITLVGFLGKNRYNLYTHPERLLETPPNPSPIDP